MQGRGARVPHPQYLACQHICRKSKVLVNVSLLTELKESLICRQIGIERSLFVGKLGSSEVYLSANWDRAKFICRQIGIERSLFVGKLGSSEVYLSANWDRAKFICRQICLFVGKLGLCTPTKISSTFPPVQIP